MPNSSLYADRLLQEIQSETGEIRLMEVCGTHTMAIAKSGLSSLLPPNLQLLSGPGCPVCVTSPGDIDEVIELARLPGVILATFGDMMRVPGTRSSLQEERSRGADIRVVYYTLDALRIARDDPGREVVFLGIGFETTTPAVAITVEQAAQENLRNFAVWSLHKLVPPALEALFSDPELKVNGLICPGHVAAIIGIKPFGALAEKYRRPCVVTGFTDLDILEGIYVLLSQLRNDRASAEIQYRRVVKPEGNVTAQEAMARVFEPLPARWRGLGTIPASGLGFLPRYAPWDARRRFDIPEIEDRTIPGCVCGEILKGKLSPHQCRLFGQACTPLRPVGPCMVSQEGACAAYYRYSSG